MKRELRLGASVLRRRSTAVLAAWSVPEILPTAVYGLAVAHATDAFLAGRTSAGLAWLGGLLAAAGLGAVGANQVYRRLGDLVEPFRDELVRKVVAGALHSGVQGRPTDGAVARLNRQVEIVRDTFAGLILVGRSFTVTVIGVVAGLLSLAPLIAALVVPPFLVGFGLSLALLGLAAGRVRASLRADEELATSAGMVFSGLRDVTAAGAEDFAEELVGEPIEAHAMAERSLARVAALRTVCFAVGGWLPLLILLAAGPWLVGRGVSTGTLLGGLTYVLIGLQPALGTVMSALGHSGLRFVVTLGRILDTAAPAETAAGTAAETAAGTAAGTVAASPAETYAVTPAGKPVKAPAGDAADRSGELSGVVPVDHQVKLRRVSFAYGPHAEPVLQQLDLTVPEGDHLAVVGPSGIGKSPLAALVCGLLRPTAGQLLVGGVPPADLGPESRAGSRVLIPQEAYVFSATVLDNLAYLRPAAAVAEVEAAVQAVGAGPLIQRLGGPAAQLRPASLSAGERQLIALARAYLCPAPLVVLDEATCHLDPESEARAEEAFAARPGTTLVVIAHRVSSALRARRVLVLDGRNATLGSHAELLRESVLYRELVGHWQVPTVHQAAVQQREGNRTVARQPAAHQPVDGRPAGQIQPAS